MIHSNIIYESFREFLERNNTKDEEITCEDFAVGVADCGADQGIPHGGDCKAAVAKRMFPLQRRFKLKKKKKVRR